MAAKTISAPTSKTKHRPTARAAPISPATVAIQPVSPVGKTLLTQMPLSAANGLLATLNLLGLQTVEDALGVLHVAGPNLVRALGLSHEALASFASAAQAIAAEVTEADRDIINKADYELGVAIDQIPMLVQVPDLPPLAPVPPGSAPAASAAPVETPPAPPGAPAPAAPADVNLIPQMPPIRNQFKRGTCVAFATLATYEHLLLLNGTKVDLAEQFLYWDCKAHDHHPGSGTWLGVAFPRLHQDGCCLKDTWPYVPIPVPGNEGQGPPPPGAQIEALSYRPLSFLTLAPNAVADIKATLLSGRCVAVSVPVYNTLMLNQQALKSGDIQNPVPGELPVGGHAICLVGYVDDPTAPGQGGGRFLVRNSWGANFGFASPYGVGYGTIPYSYIARRGKEAYAVT